MVVDGQGIVAAKVGELVEDVEWEGPFARIGRFGVANLVLFADVADDCLSFGLHEDVTGVDDRGMSNDAVRHGVGGDVSLVVPDVGYMGCPLRLIISEYDGGSWWGRGDAGDKLRVRVDYTLRIAVGLSTAIAHDPGFTG